MFNPSRFDIVSLYRIAQEGFKRGIFRSDEGLAFLHMFKPPSDALPLPQSSTKTSRQQTSKSVKHDGRGKKSGSLPTSSSTCSTQPSILDMVREQVAEDAASEEYQSLRREAHPLIPGSDALLQATSNPPLPISVQPSAASEQSTASSEQPSSQGLSGRGQDSCQSPRDEPASSSSPPDEPGRERCPSDDLQAEAKRLLDEAFGVFNEETNRAQFEYPPTIKSLLRLVEGLKSEKQTLKEGNISLHKEIEMMTARVKMMEENHTRKTISAMEKLLKSSFESGLKGFSEQISLGNNSIKTELAAVLAAMAKSNVDSGRSLLPSRPPPGFGPPVGVPAAVQSPDLRAVLDRKRGSSPTHGQAAAKTFKSSEGALASQSQHLGGSSAPSDQLYSGSGPSPSLTPGQSGVNQHVGGSSAPSDQFYSGSGQSGVNQPVAAPPGLATSPSSQPGQLHQSGVLQSNFHQSSSAASSAQPAFRPSHVPTPPTSQSLPQSHQLGIFTTPPPSYPQQGNRPPPVSSQLPLASNPCSATSRVPQPGGAQGAHLSSGYQMNQPSPAGDSSYAMQEQSSHVASSRVIFSGFFYQVMVK